MYLTWNLHQLGIRLPMTTIFSNTKDSFVLSEWNCHSLSQLKTDRWKQLGQNESSDIKDWVVGGRSRSRL